MLLSSRPDTDKTPTWAKATAHPAQEFPLQPLPVLAGQVPEGIRGSLYRNGPGRLERNGQRVGHWFDGDGAILAVHFQHPNVAATATATYRYVQSAGYVAEQEADQFLFSGYGMTPPGSVWQRWGKPFKNAANTSVLALPDRLLALWEGGQPHALDLETLATLGLDNLDNLSDQENYSAHPKRDPTTGNIFNFGLKAGANATLNLYRSDRSGQVVQRNQLQLEGLPLIHDFAFVAPYLIFCIAPVRLNPLPALLAFKSFGDSLTWQPQKGTEILIFDCDRLELVSRSQVDPWFQWHFGNGYLDADGWIELTLVQYPDWTINQYLKEVATGKTQTAAKAKFVKLYLDPQSAQLKFTETLISQDCEFPVVPSEQAGQRLDDSYLVIHREGADIAQDMFGAIAHYHHSSGQLTVADCGQGVYPSEPICVTDADNPQQTWILTVVFDSTQQSSEVWIFNGQHLSDGPVCRLGLPSVVPPSFHGTWHPLTI